MDKLFYSLKVEGNYKPSVVYPIFMSGTEETGWVWNMLAAAMTVDLEFVRKDEDRDEWSGSHRLLSHPIPSLNTGEEE